MSDTESPAGLEAAGQRLWDAIVGPYILTPTELANLAQAARTADEVDRLEREVRKLSSLTAKGSTGQLRAHPLLAELRAHRALLQNLMEALNLPDQDQQVGLRAGARRTRKATLNRWNRETAS
jgi:hypothetical protein